jgi:hypothetical protein
VEIEKISLMPFYKRRGVTRQISSASANFVIMIWWCNSPRRNVIYLTAVANGLWGEKELLTIAMVFLVSLHILKFSATRQP